MRPGNINPSVAAILGGGKTKKEALADYAAELCGKWIVVNAYATVHARQEFQLPPVITP